MFLPLAIEGCSNTTQIISVVFAIFFGLWGVATSIGLLLEKKKAKDKAAGISEGATTVMLNDMTSSQAVILDNVKEISKTQNANHLEMCTQIAVMKNDIERHETEIAHIGSDVRQLQKHIWGSPKTDYNAAKSRGDASCEKT